MKKLALVLSGISLSLLSIVTANAQCTGWPVTCTGIHPTTVSPGNLAGAAEVGTGAYALGEAIGTAIFGDVDAAMPFENRGIALFNEGIKIESAFPKGKQEACNQAMPKFREALLYMQKAHDMVPINIHFNRNLGNLQNWMTSCNTLNLQGVNAFLEGKAMVAKGQCRQAMVKWTEARSYYQRAAAAYQNVNVNIETINSNFADTNNQIAKLAKGEYSGCTLYASAGQSDTGNNNNPTNVKACQQCQGNLRSALQSAVRFANYGPDYKRQFAARAIIKFHKCYDKSACTVQFPLAHQVETTCFTQGQDASYSVGCIAHSLQFETAAQ